MDEDSFSISKVSNNGATFYGLTNDGKIFGWRYRGYIPTGFVAVPLNRR